MTTDLKREFEEVGADLPEVGGLDPPVAAHVEEPTAPLAAAAALSVVVLLVVLGFGHKLDAVPLTLAPEVGSHHV